MTEWVFGLFDALGAAGVGLLIFLDNFFPPIPSEVVLPLAGFRARTGAIDPVLVWPAPAFSVRSRRRRGRATAPWPTWTRRSR